MKNLIVVALMLTGCVAKPPTDEEVEQSKKPVLYSTDGKCNVYRFGVTGLNGYINYRYYVKCGEETIEVQDKFEECKSHKSKQSCVIIDNTVSVGEGREEKEAH